MKWIKYVLLFVLVLFPAVFYVWGSVTLEHIAYGAIGLSEPVSVEDSIKVDPVRPVAFVGDILLGRDVEESIEEYGTNYPYALFYDLPLYSAVVANFESAIPKVHLKTPPLTTRFSTKEEYVPDLFNHGITHVSLANNHSYDFGRNGFEHTTLTLKRNYISPFGNPETISTSSVSIIDMGTTTLSVVGIHALHRTPTRDEIKNVLEYAASNSDYVIAYVHWGDEYVSKHNASQERLAFTLIDLGVDAVIGHHPHVVQDIERYAGKPIIYSLGNFIFDQYFSKEVQEGLLLELSFTDTEAVYTLKPVSSVGSRNRPRLMTGFERDEFLKNISQKSTQILKNSIEAGEIRFKR